MEKLETSEFNIIQEFEIEDFVRIDSRLKEFKKTNPDKARRYIDWLIERINSFHNFLNIKRNSGISDEEEGVFRRIWTPEISDKKHHFKGYSVRTHGDFLTEMIAYSIMHDSEQPILQPLTDYLIEEKKFIRANKKISAKHYALFHWCRIHFSEVDKIARDINDKFPKQEIFEIAKNESYHCNHQAFYKNLIGIYSSNIEVLASEFKRSDWLIVYQLSGFNKKFHKLLNKVQRIKNSK